MNRDANYYVKTSYKPEDVTLLLKDVTGLVEPQPTEERERLIQAGRHYCEMLPIEYVPTPRYMQVYEEALRTFSKPTAEAVSRLGDKIMTQKGEGTVLVSLARAGIPIGILLKRYILKKYGVNMPHYSISIIRGRGIDHCAMKYMLDRHSPKNLLFVDGWIGKGAILRELQKELANYEGVSSDIAVVADPANVTELCGTHDDILIPSSCLNSTVSGLVSRTFLRDDIIGKDDFHGAVYYGELKDADLSYEFIDAIEAQFNMNVPEENEAIPGKGIDEVKMLAEKYSVDDINLIKPGIGEATRVLLRRVPWKVLIDERYKDSAELAHLIRLAQEKNVPIEYCGMTHYKTCGIIKKLADA
ncbi:MAG: cysteine protease StiP family protein [Clostridia bacterium]|nr:cysteine protease StiP family protein [Clostridia bacterium]